MHGIFESFHKPYSIPNLDVLLPVGISFHTFQALSYTIDLCQRKIPVEKSFARLALFVTFFPLLVAGPIDELFFDSIHLNPKGRDVVTHRLAADLKQLLAGKPIADESESIQATRYADGKRN